MGINDIHLPEFIIEEWFRDNLVPRTPPSPLAPASAPAQNPIPPLYTATPPASASIPLASASTPLASAPTPPASTPGPGSATLLKYLGNNRNNITLLVHSPGSTFLPDNQLTFLTKILEACRMTLADVAIVNAAAAAVTITEIRRQLQPTTILLFGIEPSAMGLPINFPPFRPQAYDGCTYLAAPSLEQLVPSTEDSRLLKSKLWVCLKTIFSV